MGGSWPTTVCCTGVLIDPFFFCRIQWQQLDSQEKEMCETTPDENICCKQHGNSVQKHQTFRFIPTTPFNLSQLILVWCCWPVGRGWCCLWRWPAGVEGRRSVTEAQRRTWRRRSQSQWPKGWATPGYPPPGSPSQSLQTCRGQRHWRGMTVFSAL